MWTQHDRRRDKSRLYRKILWRLGLAFLILANIAICFSAYEMTHPAEYAKKIDCPVLLIYGAKDNKVTRKEMDDIYNNLQGPKKLTVYPLGEHAAYWYRHKKEWTADVVGFLKNK